MRQKLEGFLKTVYPPGAPILPNLLRWQGLEVYEYICALSALHLRQTRRLQDLGCKKCRLMKCVTRMDTPRNQVHKFNSKSRLQALLVANGGFTLIELLVVLIILGITVSLVAPRLFGVYDGIKASAEEQKLEQVLELVKMRAFLRQVPYTIQFDAHDLKIKNHDSGIRFEYIYFPKADLHFNGNGFSDRKSLIYRLEERKKVLDIS